jgi:predicted 3-demethylubiquinone-9 3-methyltransferase (glyoxalase superfamily)
MIMSSWTQTLCNTCNVHVQQYSTFLYFNTKSKQTTTNFYFNVFENKLKTIQQLIGENKEEARQWAIASGVVSC